jgi:alanyl-tRNA synthetase
MDTEQTVSTFIDFFRDRGHRHLTGDTLVRPPGDSVLFTTSGMHPLTPYLLGRPHPLGQRLTSRQRCLRTTDLDEIGDGTHLTVFEMLGSWSLGDYEGPQSLRWGHELLTGGFGLDPRLLHATVFGGDSQTGEDTGSLRTWQELGVPVEPTVEDNWWSNGPTGPCGPDSEIFLWTGDGPPQGTPTTDPRWVEIWNHVTMRYHRGEDGGLRPLSRPSVDTGMGLDRLTMLLQGKRSVFDTDTFEPWMTALPPLWGLPDESSLRLVVDHLRSALVVIGDGVLPSNTGRGYVLRRLTRRALTTLWRDDPSRTVADLPPELIEHTRRRFRQTADVQQVHTVLLDEQQRFRRLLERGRQVLRGSRFSGPLRDEDFGYLHDTHGLPRDLVTTLLRERD